MAHSKLPLPEATETIAFRTLVEVLKDDPTLRRAVKTWRAWEGDPRDNDPPTANQCPWVRLSGDPAPVERITSSSHETPINFRLEVAVKGTHLDDLMNLWAAVRRALLPGDNSVLYKLREATGGGGHNLTISRPGYGVESGGKEGVMLSAEANILIGLRVNT